MRKITINRALEVLCLIILFGVPLFIVCIYDQIPEIIPIHYNIYGEIDDFGSKGIVWLFVALEILSYIGLSILQRYPQKFNFPVQLTELNKDKLFSLGRRIMLMTKLCTVTLFSYLSLCIIRVIDMNMIIIIGLIAFSIFAPHIIAIKMKKE